MLDPILPLRFHPVSQFLNWIRLSSRQWPPPCHSVVSLRPGQYFQVVGTGDCGSNPPTPPRTTPLGCLVQVVTGASPQVQCLVCCLVAMLSRGGLLVLCFRSFAFTVAPKALPCVGCCYPLHHFGTLSRCSALPHWGIHHWCSGSPIGRPLRHVSIRSGPCVPFLPLSAAASRLLVSLLCVGFLCPCVVLPPLLCPPLPVSAPLALLCVRPSRFLLVFGLSSCVLPCSVGASVCCLHVEFVCVLIGAT